MDRYAVEVISIDKNGESWEQPLRLAALATLEMEPVPVPAGLTILLTDDAHLHELNLTYRQEDKPTDVLSFHFAGPAGLEMDGYLGDIAISVETAHRQAQAAGHALLDELRILTVHGVLHLLGYDHDKPAAQAAMWAVQDKILLSFVQ